MDGTFDRPADAQVFQVDSPGISHVPPLGRQAWRPALYGSHISQASRPLGEGLLVFDAIVKEQSQQDNNSIPILPEVILRRRLERPTYLLAGGPRVGLGKAREG
jgi:hypothetical protein